ncbi:hypothetical protein [Dermatophilus congolensis]|uniref:Uncharacterized protein n=1 Tax=Dermatophilus congolensis TaxID=1863 RepID=A0A239VAG0_9MICO|nr:hypothetical protein [Dermatophilus congolensis]MBO3130517.1 hypothetical protein [Dermatophilus congolensis]MBO3130853.1 hypothetical protein [Dermatophilus congolensis]MBO3134989.1 hypothetical protein [Dermatophilus congolensis]MBO3137228.1 hypothetical protein [Dermatophilus congolensis]MBO3139473.1 hypothetical protein [Dermatophilus congolensis]
MLDPRHDTIWRARHSAWMLPILLGAGLIAWAGFAWIAFRARRKSWWIIAAAYLLGAAAVLFWPPAARGKQSTALLALWASAIAVAVILRNPYLECAYNRQNSCTHHTCK